ncbi:MAG TPA: cation diffusion facilitator family transporter [Terriglobia bacterium]|nr:cation diffusion facilitator family transporter [Terriglobia bacterium]
MHSHHHDHHHHGLKASKVVKIALVVTLALVVTEFVVGMISHSLALVSDGWHNLTDVPSLILSWIALYFERRPPDDQKTFGYQRAGVLVAFVNALLLVAVGIYLIYEGYQRIMRPEPVASGPMLVVGVIALVVNGGISWGLLGERSDLNLRAVFIHNLGDAFSNVAIIAGAWVIRATGRTIIDPVLGFLIAGLILWSALGIVSDSINILMESLPKGMSLESVAAAMLRVEGVKEVHDVHIWCLGSKSLALSCHVHILDMPTSESEQIARQVREMLAHEFDIYHTTIQFEHTHPPGEFHIYMPDPAPSNKGK